MGAGSGRWGAACRRHWPEASITGIEIREIAPHPAYDHWITGSFPEALDEMACYDLILGNPPYALAEKWIKAALTLLPANHEKRPRSDGNVAFLLRLAFLEGQKRRDDLFRRHPFRSVAICSKRPSFQADGRTNATAFGFFVWHPALDWLSAPTVHFLR